MGMNHRNPRPLLWWSRVCGLKGKNDVTKIILHRVIAVKVISDSKVFWSKIVQCTALLIYYIRRGFIALPATSISIFLYPNYPNCYVYMHEE